MKGTREVEAKFRVHPGFRLPDLEATTGVAEVEEAQRQELRAVYWDTADLRLAREGITLRHRSGEGDGDGWHLKLPVATAGGSDAGIGTRDELHEPASEERVPESLLDLVAVHLRSAAIGPVATLCTERSVYRLCADDGRLLCELTDDIVSVVNQGHVAARFREIEVEDRDGGLPALLATATALKAAGAVSGEFVPKVIRALGPRAIGDPDPPPAGVVRPSDTTKSAVEAVLRRYVRNLMRRDIDARRGAADAVHQMRVAARRLRSALKTFRPVLDEAWADSLREELAWVADELGGARDAEVLLARLQRDLDDLPPELVSPAARTRITASVGADLDRGTEATAALLHSDRYLALIQRLVDAAWEPMVTPAADAPVKKVLPRLLRVTWDRLNRRASRLQSDDATDEHWHQARIAAKQARYAFESVTPIYGRRAKRVASYAEEVQELLGEHQDAAIASGVIRELATTPRSAAVGFTLGLLYASQRDAVARTRSEFPKLWRRAGAARHRRWLAG